VHSFSSTTLVYYVSGKGVVPFSSSVREGLESPVYSNPTLSRELLVLAFLHCGGGVDGPLFFLQMIRPKPGAATIGPPLLYRSFESILEHSSFSSSKLNGPHILSDPDVGCSFAKFIYAARR